MKMKSVWCSTILSIIILHLQIITGARSDQVLLQDVKAITLHHGQMTNARRSPAVPQLKCVGGTAGCDAFRPQTVQCINRGWDGYDVQWECMTDMDNSYRFGNLEVNCEGYNYPDDPYILRGSCGLEYTLDLTEEGHQRKNSYHHGSHGNQHDDDYYHRSTKPSSYSKKASSVFQDLIYLGIVAGIVYIIYKTCIATPDPSQDAPPPYDDTFRSHDQHQRGPPPPYGFRQEYMPNSGESCSSGANYSSQTHHTPPGGSTGGGFWSGMFSGGVLGYLFGSSNSTYNNYGYQRPRTSWWGGRSGWGNGWGTGWGNGWGNSWGNGWGSRWGNGGGWGSSWGNGGGWGSRTHTTYRAPSSSSSFSRSSGTRTASGFGGTKRR